MATQSESVVITLAVFMAAALAHAAVIPVTPAESKLWINHCLPLPHEIAISGSVAVAAAELGVKLSPEAGAAEQQAANDLTEWLKTQTGVAPTGAAFEIVIGVPDANGNLNGLPVEAAARLKDLPNKEQAYIICPQCENRLVVAGLTGKGVFYGVQTLRQLLGAKLTRGAITVPLAAVTDWPDMEERGVWNSAKAVPWLGSLKLNFCTYSCGLSMDTNGWMRASLDPKFMELLKRHAMVERVQVSHLNYWGHRNPGLYKLYPELKGQGDKAVPAGEAYKFAGRDIANICASQPHWKELVARMLCDLGEQHAPEVSVWLSEFEGQCQCAECLKSTQVQLESKMVVDAWQEARKKYPGLGLRIFYSQGDATPATAQALADLPPEVKIERVYQIYKPFLDAAQKGQWVLSFSGGGHIGGTHLRFFVPEQQIQTIKDGYASKFKGVLILSGSPLVNLPGYYAQVFNYQVSARAEWSWNIKGRSSREFMEAWATRQGYDDPARFADWAETIGNLSTLLVAGKSGGEAGIDAKGYASPFRTMVDKIRRRQPFAIYSTQELAQAMSLCQKAMGIAGPLNQLEAAVETRYLLAYLNLQDKLTVLSDCVTTLDLTRAESRRQLQDAARDFKSAVEPVLEAKARQIELSKDEPADYPAKAIREIRVQWDIVLSDADAALVELIKNPGAIVLRPSGKHVIHASRAAGPVLVDGHLNEQCWASGFTTSGWMTTSYTPSVVTTEVAACHDSTNLYLAFRCFGQDAAKLKKTAGQEDAVFKDDAVVAMIQPDRGKSDHYQLAVSAGGVRFDQRCRQGESYDTDGFNPAWQATVSQSGTVWEVEMAIPWEMIGREASATNALGINFGRSYWAPEGNRQESSSWTGAEAWHATTYFGELDLIDHK